MAKGKEKRKPLEDFEGFKLSFRPPVIYRRVEYPNNFVIFQQYRNGVYIEPGTVIGKAISVNGIKDQKLIWDGNGILAKMERTR